MLYPKVRDQTPALSSPLLSDNDSERSDEMRNHASPFSSGEQGYQAGPPGADSKRSPTTISLSDTGLPLGSKSGSADSRNPYSHMSHQSLDQSIVDVDTRLLKTDDYVGAKHHQPNRKNPQVFGFQVVVSCPCCAFIASSVVLPNCQSIFPNPSLLMGSTVLRTANWKNW